MQNFIGIGGVIATILSAFITAIVTWIVAKKTQVKREIAYRLSYEPILPEHISEKANDMSVSYKGKVVENPYIMYLYIINRGNRSITIPDMEINTGSDVKILGWYMEDDKSGYNRLCSVNISDGFKCNIKMEYINPRQCARLRFILEGKPPKNTKLICVIKDTVVVDLDEEDERKENSFWYRLWNM